MEQSIPVVDLKDFIYGTPAQRANFVRVVGDALCDLGFFAVENHQIDDLVIRRAYELMAQFFELPQHLKQAYVDPNGMGQRGFTQFGTEHAKDHVAPDLKEFWHVGQELVSDHELLSVYGSNIWPSEILKYFEEIKTVAP